MKKTELINIITNLVNDKINNKVEREEVKYNDILQDPVSEEIIKSFPYLNDTLIDLMSKDYKLFINRIEWVAPKPTTFRVVLKNNNIFLLTWSGKEYTLNINGINFDLGIIGQEMRAIKLINNALIYGPFEKADDGMEGDLDNFSGGDGTGGISMGSDGSFPGDDEFTGFDDIPSGPEDGNPGMDNFEDGDGDGAGNDDGDEIDVDL